METKHKRDNLFYTVSGFVALILVVALDCHIGLKALFVLGVIALYLLGIFGRWSKERWVIGLMLCISLLNIFFEWTIYGPYRNMWSAAANKQIGFSTSQVCYVYNTGNADALICALLRDRTVSVYGNCEMYRSYFELYSGKISAFDCNQNMDYLTEEREAFWDMGRLSIASVADCFTDEEVEMLKELRNNREQPYQLYVSKNSDKIIDEGELIVAIDSAHNIYIMPKEEWDGGRDK